MTFYPHLYKFPNASCSNLATSILLQFRSETLLYCIQFLSILVSAMAFRTVEITIISARDLNDVNVFSKIKAYAVAWIQGSQTYDKKKSPVDKENRTNPNWNYSMQFLVEEAALLQGRLVLEVEIRAQGTFSDEEIGRVSVLLKDFVKTAADGTIKAGAQEYVTYQVRKPSGKPKGMLNFSVKIGERTDAPNSYQKPSAPTGYNQANAYGSGGGSFSYPPPAAAHKGDEPVTAYPVYPPGPSSAYPPPPPPPHNGNSYPPPPPPPPPYGNSYPPPPQDPYYPPAYPPQYQGYPPQGYPPQGYPQQYQGYPPVQQQKPPKKNKFGGMGLGAGLLGGALGGLLIGDIIGESSSFDGGFDDGGGFDF